MKTLIYSLVLFFTGTFITAQKNTNNNNYPSTHQIGMNLGNSAGVGLSYRLNMDKNAVQFSALPIFIDGESFFSFSAGYLRRIRTDRAVNFSWLTNASVNNLFDFQTNGISTSAQLELNVFDILSIECQAGMGYFQDTDNYSETKSSRISPVFGVSMFYNL